MLTNEQSTLLTEGARLLQVELTVESIDRIAVYLEELQRWAKIVDLVSQSDLETIIRKHVLDSLAALSVLPAQGRLLDLGSGAGLPGLPIAATRPTLEVSLLEPRRKRVNFLKEVIRKANLKNTKAHEDLLYKEFFVRLRVFASSWFRHHTRHESARTIGCPALHENALANSGMFDTTPLTRWCGGECGLVCASMRSRSGREFVHQLWP